MLCCADRCRENTFWQVQFLCWRYPWYIPWPFTSTWGAMEIQPASLSVTRLQAIGSFVLLVLFSSASTLIYTFSIDEKTGEQEGNESQGRHDHLQKHVDGEGGRQGLSNRHGRHVCFIQNSYSPLRFLPDSFRLCLQHCIVASICRSY